jgi:hypothetical protein
MDIYNRIRRLNEKPTPTLAINAEVKDMHTLEEYKVWCFNINYRSAPDRTCNWSPKSSDTYHHPSSGPRLPHYCISHEK